MAEKTLLQEVTGIRLYTEEKRLINEEQYKKLKNRVIGEDADPENRNILNKEICDVYFSSTILGENAKEQFILTMEENGKRKHFILKRRNKIGTYLSEKKIKLSKKEYVNILCGYVDWMKESEKVLINEFYCKMKLFQFKVSKIVKSTCEEIYLKCEKLSIQFLNDIQQFTADNELVQVPSSNKKLLVKIRSNVEPNRMY